MMQRRFDKNRANRCRYHIHSNALKNASGVKTTVPTTIASIAVKAAICTRHKTVVPTAAETYSG